MSLEKESGSVLELTQCPHCRGTGTRHPLTRERCSMCDGRGQLTRELCESKITDRLTETGMAAVASDLMIAHSMSYTSGSTTTEVRETLVREIGRRLVMYAEMVGDGGTRARDRSDDDYTYL